MRTYLFYCGKHLCTSDGWDDITYVSEFDVSGDD